MKFGVPMMTNRSKSKSEEEYQYGGRQFSKTSSSYTAMDWTVPSVSSQVSPQAIEI